MADNTSLGIEPERSVGSTEQRVCFGTFCLLARQRLLLDAGKPVRLGCRAFDILVALVQRPGALVTKRELMRAVWPDISVVESNLTVHVAALRRVLGDGQAGNRFILNVVGRGYCFVAPVCCAENGPLQRVDTRAWMAGDEASANRLV